MWGRMESCAPIVNRCTGRSPVLGVLCRRIHRPHPPRLVGCDRCLLAQNVSQFIHALHHAVLRKRVHRKLHYPPARNNSPCTSAGTTIGSSEFFSEFCVKMSANEVLITARKPNCVSAHGACSRELPQPKLSPASSTCAPVTRGWFNRKSGFGFPAAS